MDAAQTMDREHHPGKGLGHSLKKAFNFVAKTAVLGVGLYAFMTLGEFTLLHSGLEEGVVISNIAEEFFTPIFEATGITGWAGEIDTEPVRSALKSVHEFFGINDTFEPLSGYFDGGDLDFAGDFDL